jgi:hypothetical protein
MRTQGCVTALLAMALSSAQAWAVPPITYEGTLLDGSGGAADGIYTMQGDIYDAPVDGTLFGTTGATMVTVTSGRFTLDLTHAFLVSTDTVWLQLTVTPPSGGTGDVLSRVRISTVPYAARAATVDWSGVTNPPPAVALGTEDVGSAACPLGGRRLTVGTETQVFCNPPAPRAVITARVDPQHNLMGSFPQYDDVASLHVTQAGPHLVIFHVSTFLANAQAGGVLRPPDMYCELRADGVPLHFVQIGLAAGGNAGGAVSNQGKQETTLSGVTGIPAAGATLTLACTRADSSTAPTSTVATVLARVVPVDAIQYGSFN